jgi:preprotein translocase subunit SecE
MMVGEGESCLIWKVCRRIWTGFACLGEVVLNKILQFIRESYAELRRVVWPGRDDVVSSVRVVIISTVIFALVLGLVDVLLLLGVQAIF